jgi:hypothetical protein
VKQAALARTVRSTAGEQAVFLVANQKKSTDDWEETGVMPIIGQNMSTVRTRSPIPDSNCLQ